MPSNCSSTCRPRTRDAVNFVRYHHGTAYGLVESIGRCTKFWPILYDMPGSSRRFIPKNGSLNVPFSTSAPTTVDGAVAVYHPLASYAADEIFSPSTPTFADDCSRPPLCSIRP